MIANRSLVENSGQGNRRCILSSGVGAFFGSPNLAFNVSLLLESVPVRTLCTLMLSEWPLISLLSRFRTTRGLDATKITTHSLRNFQSALGHGTVISSRLQVGKARHSSSSSSSRWQTRHGKDRFAREARVQGLKSRAAFKLLEVSLT